MNTDDLKNMIVNIRNNVDVVHADYSDSGIIYLWTFLNTEKNVEKIVNKLYPNMFGLKINKTNSEIPKDLPKNQRIYLGTRRNEYCTIN